MAEYIEREKAIAEIKNYALEAYDIDLDDSKQFAGNSTGEKYCEGLYEATEILEEVPSADVVEVVRCKDCEYCCISTDLKTNISIQKCGYVGFNPVQSSQVSDDFYCSYGELKEREG